MFGESGDGEGAEEGFDAKKPAAMEVDGDGRGSKEAPKTSAGKVRGLLLYSVRA